MSLRGRGIAAMVFGVVTLAGAMTTQAATTLDASRIQPGMTIAEAQLIASRHGGVLSSPATGPLVYRFDLERAIARDISANSPLFYAYPINPQGSASEPQNLRIYLVEGAAYDPRFERRSTTPQLTAQQALETLLSAFGPAEILTSNARQPATQASLVFEPGQQRTLRLPAEVATAFVTRTQAPAAASSAVRDCVALRDRLRNFPEVYGYIARNIAMTAGLGNPMSGAEVAKMIAMTPTSQATAQAYVDARFGAGSAAAALACGKIQTAALSAHQQVASAAEYLAGPSGHVAIFGIDFREAFKAYEAFKAFAERHAQGATTQTSGSTSSPAATQVAITPATAAAPQDLSVDAEAAKVAADCRENAALNRFVDCGCWHDAYVRQRAAAAPGTSRNNIEATMRTECVSPALHEKTNYTECMRNMNPQLKGTDKSDYCACIGKQHGTLDAATMSRQSSVNASRVAGNAIRICEQELQARISRLEAGL